MDAHERPGSETIAETIDERVDKALRFVLHLAFDDRVESLARWLCGSEVANAQQNLHAREDGQFRRELTHREPVLPKPRPVEHCERQCNPSEYGDRRLRDQSERDSEPANQASREQKLDEDRAELHREFNFTEVLSAEVTIVDGAIDELALLVIKECSDQPVKEGIRRDPTQIALTDDQLEAAPEI